jgi:hypothetical protein
MESGVTFASASVWYCRYQTSIWGVTFARRAWVAVLRCVQNETHPWGGLPLR